MCPRGDTPTTSIYSANPDNNVHTFISYLIPCHHDIPLKGYKTRTIRDIVASCQFFKNNTHRESKAIMNTTPAGNAVRHGLSSLRHMPKGRESELGPIELDLIESRQPQTPEQLEIVHELAFAMWQKGEHERVMIQEAEKLAEKSGELFDQKALEDYQKLHKLWIENPFKYTDSMIESKLGAEHFTEIWQGIINMLKDGHGPTIQAAISAIRTEGCSPSPHSIHGDGMWLMNRAMAFKPDLEEFIKEWLEEVDAGTSYDALFRANVIGESILEKQESFDELCDRAIDRLNHWRDVLVKLSNKHNKKRQDFINQYSVNVMSSEELEKQALRLHRYRVFTENRIKELNKRLANIRAEILKKERFEEEKEYRKQKHEMAVAQLQRHEFEQLMEYRNAVDSKNATMNSNPEPPQNLVLTDQDLDKIPPDWQNHKPILTNAIPNAELFSLWTNEQMIESGHLIVYLMQLPGTNKHWMEQITSCQEYELQLRSLTLPNRE